MKEIKNQLAVLFVLVACILTACWNRSLDIYSEIEQYEWTDMYVHEYSYEYTCSCLFSILPGSLSRDEFNNSLDVIIKDEKNSIDIFGIELKKCFIPAYGGKYMNGIPMKNRDSWEERYATTLEVIRTLHKEYIEMGIIQKKSS